MDWLVGVNHGAHGSEAFLGWNIPLKQQWYYLITQKAPVPSMISVCLSSPVDALLRYSLFPHQLVTPGTRSRCSQGLRTWLEAAATYCKSLSAAYGPVVQRASGKWSTEQQSSCEEQQDELQRTQHTHTHTGKSLPEEGDEELNQVHDAVVLREGNLLVERDTQVNTHLKVSFSVKETVGGSHFHRAEHWKCILLIFCSCVWIWLHVSSLLSHLFIFLLFKFRPVV